MKIKRTPKYENRGFRLVEMLVVIAVIGILAGIAIGAMSSTNSTAKTNAAKRNAQSLCSLYNSARLVGAEFAAGTKAGILEEMIVGKSGGDLTGSQFKFSPLAPRPPLPRQAKCPAFNPALSSPPNPWRPSR